MGCRRRCRMDEGDWNVVRDVKIRKRKRRRSGVYRGGDLLNVDVGVCEGKVGGLWCGVVFE